MRRNANSIVSIDYTEGDSGSYRGVVLTGSAGEEARRWMTGNPPDDWASYRSWAQAGADAGKDMFILESSSITHFLWDVPGWRMILDGGGREIIVTDDCQDVGAQNEPKLS